MPDKFPPEGWSPTESFGEAILTMARKELKWFEWRKKFAVAKCLRDPDFRFVLEAQVTDMALRAGAIPPQGDQVVSYGDYQVFVGNWLTDLLEWVLLNAPAIIELIMTIISLFNAGKLSAEDAAMMIGYIMAGAAAYRELIS